jgi:hypothetical protein
MLEKYRAIFEYITKKERENVQRFVEQEAKFVDTVDQIKNLLEQRSSTIPDIPDQFIETEISPPTSPAPASKEEQGRTTAKDELAMLLLQMPLRRVAAHPSYTKRLWHAFGTPIPGMPVPTPVPYPYESSSREQAKDLPDFSLLLSRNL